MIPDEAAWQFCGCPDARHRRRIEKQINTALEHVEELFGDGAGRMEMPPVQYQTVLGLLRDAVIEVANDRITSATVGIPGGGVAVIKIGSKGEIKVTRRMSRAVTMDATI